jgi:hypothetical protein
MRPHTEYFNPAKRTSAWVSSDDFLNWGPPILAVAPNEDQGPEAEYYRMTVARYEGIHLGFIWVYHNDVEFADQSRDTILAVSRDGITWSRPFGAETFLDTGRKGEWDSKFAGACNMVPVGDELWIYYSGANIPHNVKNETGGRGSVRDWPGRVIDGEHRAYAVGLAKLRRDGFVAMEPERHEGTVTTRPLTFLGTRLKLNIAASQGTVQVEVLDDKGQPVEGYSRSECESISSDSMAYTVTWRGGRDLVHSLDTQTDVGGSDLQVFESTLRRPVKLKFYINGAKLYSFSVE